MPRRKSSPPSGVLTERVDSDGRRNLSLTKRERSTAQRQQLAERAAALFLDIHAHHSWPEIANELGISVNSLKDLVKTKEFDDAYNLLFPEVGHDPRFRAAKSALGDMVGTAIQKLQEMLEGGENVPKSLQWKAIEKVLNDNQIRNTGQNSEKAELMDFLKDMGGVNINTVNIVPPEFAKELARISGEVVEAVAEDIPS